LQGSIRKNEMKGCGGTKVRNKRGIRKSKRRKDGLVYLLIKNMETGHSSMTVAHNLQGGHNSEDTMFKCRVLSSLHILSF
jgi:hypothetical protein